ncbi:hypothetical protein HS088_TW21G01771 [Tripterygium wilfordii]|uniref:Uncharacterized protein n=1 Tax=Tripterygium wilfordii TaxID=458696 RepID=A0A7J7C643_TRIWF|nr:hypothetical protein HS088_TW21G01771 [Tripterygium wilfordii]
MNHRKEEGAWDAFNICWSLGWVSLRFFIYFSVDLDCHRCSENLQISHDQLFFFFFSFFYVKSDCVCGNTSHTNNHSLCNRTRKEMVDHWSTFCFFWVFRLLLFYYRALNGKIYFC